MTDVIDHSALAESRIATQYKASERFRAYIRALMAQSQELEDVFQAVALSRDIDAAVGEQLDIIGEIVGVSRIVDGVIIVPFFNFNGAMLAEPFGEEGNLWIGGRFYEEDETITGSSVLADPEYRLLIRAKIVRNHSKGTNDDILQALSYLFDDAPAGIVDDIGGMAIDIGIGRRLTNIEYALITELDILPRPAGVRINRIVNYTSGEVFGFDGVPGAMTFGEEDDPTYGGVFAEDVTDGLPGYPDAPSISPDFTGYFDRLSQIEESGLPYEVTSLGKVMTINGGTEDSSLVAYFSTSGNTGKHLILLKVSSLADDQTVTFSLTVGFGKLSMGTLYQSVALGSALFGAGNYGNRSGGSAQLFIGTPDDYVLGFDHHGGSNPITSPQYVAVAYDMDTGHGEIITLFGSSVIESVPIVSGGSGSWGEALGGLSLRAFLGVTYNASSYGTTTTGGQYELELVPSSAPHGLTLPAGYTNIVP